MHAGQLEDMQRLGIAQGRGRRGAGERDVDFVGPASSWPAWSLIVVSFWF